MRTCNMAKQTARACLFIRQQTRLSRLAEYNGAIQHEQIPVGRTGEKGRACARILSCSTCLDLERHRMQEDCRVHIELHRRVQVRYMSCYKPNLLFQWCTFTNQDYFLSISPSFINSTRNTAPFSTVHFHKLVFFRVLSNNHKKSGPKMSSIESSLEAL